MTSSIQSLIRWSTLVGGSILLSGCLTTRQHDTIYSDLRIQRSVTVDFSELKELSEVSGEESESYDVSEFCDDMQEDIDNEESDIMWSSHECTVLDDVTVSTKGIGTFRDSSTLRKTNLVNGAVQYLYIVLNQDQVTLPDDSPQKDMEEDIERLGKGMMGLISEWYLTVTMPGTITSALNGTKVENNTVYYDAETIQKMINENSDIIIGSIVYPSEESRAAQRVPGSFLDRVCKRVERYKDHGSVYNRVQRRIYIRFGFTCN